MWDQNIGLDMIKTEWSILAACVKPMGKAPAYFDTSLKTDVRDDRELLDWLWWWLDEIDIIVTQNGARFDLPKINARMAMAGMKPYSPVRVIDTLKAAKKHFAFSSNKLAWTSKYLTDVPKSEHKKFPGFELWKECLAGNPKAWAEMKKYNIRDVVATEKLYLTLRPWMAGHPNIGAYSDAGTTMCTNCGSTELQARGTTVTQKGRYQRYHCQACGSWSRGKKNLFELDKRREQAV